MTVGPQLQPTYRSEEHGRRQVEQPLEQQLTLQHLEPIFDLHRCPRGNSYAAALLYRWGSHVQWKMSVSIARSMQNMSSSCIFCGGVTDTKQHQKYVEVEEEFVVSATSNGPDGCTWVCRRRLDLQGQTGVSPVGVFYCSAVQILLYAYAFSTSYEGDKQIHHSELLQLGVRPESTQST